MLVLAIDTSSAAVIAAVVEVGAADLHGVAVRDTVNPRGHTELLAPSIAECLADAGAAPNDIRAIVAGLGPGPFTGLRVGLVTAAAMGNALDVPTYGVCSLDAIASAVQDEGELLVATDARRKEVYWARYDHARARIEGPAVDRPDGVDTQAATVMAGSGARLYEPELGLPLLDRDYPDPVSLVALAAERIRDVAPSEQLVPMYLRRPDAVPGAGKAVSQ